MSIKTKFFNKKKNNFYSDDFLNDINLKTEKKVLNYIVESSPNNNFDSIESIRNTKKYLAFNEINELLNDHFPGNDIKTKKWNFSLLRNFNNIALFVENKFSFAGKNSIFLLRTIFLVFFLFLPISYAILIKIFLDPPKSSIFNPAFFTVIFSLIGFFLLYNNFKFQFTLSMGGLSFILFQLGTIVIIIASSVILSIIFHGNIPNQSDPKFKNISDSVSIILQIIFEIFIISYCFKKCGVVKFNVLTNLKKHWLLIICTTIFLTIIITLISSLTDNISKHYDSSNQDDIVNLIKSGAFMATIMFFMVVIVAPICEELAFREGIYKILGDKYVSLFASAIIFAYVHVETDIENFFSYFPAAFILSLTYFFTRSTAFTIPLHMAINLFSFIAIFLKHYYG